MNDSKNFKPKYNKHYLPHFVSTALVISALTLSGCFAFSAPPAAESGSAAGGEPVAMDAAASSDGGDEAMSESVSADDVELEAVEEEAAEASEMFASSDADDSSADAAAASAPAQTSQQNLTVAATQAPMPTASPQPMQIQAASAQSQVAPEIAKEAPPADMFFQDYGVNPFVNAAEDNLSTFAMDVDTGSYTVMRNYVQDGLLPPEEAVRVEEFVNYFDYDYAMPEQDQVFAIQIDAAKAPFADIVNLRAAAAAEQSQGIDVRTVRVGIQGYEISAEERDDVALTFVVDVSGSMDQENRLTLAKRALTMLVEELRPTDSVAIVIYGSQARTVLRPTMTTDANKNEVIGAIHSLHTEGSTNAEAGLRMAYDSAWRNFNQQANNRIILISDGVANVGATGPESIWAQIEQYAEQGITMTSVGVGMGNYNDVLMEQLADMGDGTYAYVDTMDEARRIFVDELTGTLQTIAKDAKVQVEFNQELVGAYRLIGYENRDVADQDFRDDTVDAGEIGAGHSVTALYEVILNADVDDAEENNLLTVSLRWLDPKSDEPTEIAASLMAADFDTSFADSAPDFQLAVVVAEYAEILRASQWTADMAVTEQLMDEINRIGLLMEADEKVDEFVGLIEVVEQIAPGS